MVHEINVITQDQITSLFKYSETTYDSNYGGGHSSIKIKYRSKGEIKFKHKNLRGLSFNNLHFSYACHLLIAILLGPLFSTIFLLQMPS